MFRGVRPALIQVFLSNGSQCIVATTAVDAYSGPAQGSMEIDIAGIDVPVRSVGRGFKGFY